MGGSSAGSSARALRSGHRALVAPVVAYFLAIAVDGGRRERSANVAAIAGALLFFVSDGLIGETRFVAPVPLRPGRDHGHVPPRARRVVVSLV